MTVFIASSSGGDEDPEICAVGGLGSFKEVAINPTPPL